MSITPDDEWFSSWFDSPYYHVLYKNRDDDEAQLFIKNLFEFLELESNEKVLDLGCGKGRHSRTMHELGLSTTGIDLSANSIKEAIDLSDPNIHFEVADMRSFELDEKFDAVFNLFTSFGYFDDLGDNLKVIERVCDHLKPDGWLIIDFLNLPSIAANLVASEVKIEDGIEFKISREIKDGFILKNIRFEDQGNSYQFQERVQALTLEQFQEMFLKCGLQLIHTFGNYNLEQSSDDRPRLVMVTRKYGK